MTQCKKNLFLSYCVFFAGVGFSVFFSFFLMMIEFDDKIIVPIWFYNIYNKNIIFSRNVYNLLHNLILVYVFLLKMEKKMVLYN